MRSDRDRLRALHRDHDDEDNDESATRRRRDGGGLATVDDDGGPDTAGERACLLPARLQASVAGYDSHVLQHSRINLV